MHRVSSEDLLQILRCPATGSDLVREGDALVASSGTRYALVEHVPVLLRSDNDLFDAEELARRILTLRGTSERSSHGAVGWLKAKLPVDSLNVGIKRTIGAFICALHGLTERPRVLIVGGGLVGEGLQPLLDDPSVSFVSTDVFPGRYTDVICDAHDLPFANCCFDGAICQAVLEHVLDPPRVVEEIHRVLKPGGVVLSCIPFMQQVHEGAHDFTRYSMLGHRRLYRGFDAMVVEMAGGPGMALAWSIRYFLIAALARTQRMRRLLTHATPFFTWWLPRTDKWLVGKPGAYDAAAGTLFIGIRRESPVGDRELLKEYRGLIPTPKSY